jgi:metal-responsive CopG/Arc/MetJ family transcriptional regulator
VAEQKVAKITISLPKTLLDFADQLARDRSISRSRVITDLLENEEEARIQALMAEGYREMAEENQRLAEDAFPMAGESILHNTRWDESAGG